MHECSNQTRQELWATVGNPYHFVDSGLDNVFLIGIKYRKCACGEIVAEIPSIKQLLTLIARDVVEQKFSLSGTEIRFLRKCLRMKQLDFAKQLGVEAGTLCRIENGHDPVSERTDKFVRLYYAVASKDPVLLGQIQRDLAERFSSWQHLTSPKKIVAHMTEDNEWTADLVAA